MPDDGADCHSLNFVEPGVCCGSSWVSKLVIGAYCCVRHAVYL